jgi:multimeric flavodoxin WrbA/protein-tyrosine-phosphatase
MLVLGIQGSPRKKGNTSYLLERFLEEAHSRGCRTTTIDVDSKRILPCKELVVCEKKGICPLRDDMHDEIYTLLRQADVVVMATPIFFYNVPAQLKALIDRSQTLWARKYRLSLIDPKRAWRRGFLLALGATRGKNLFEGVQLTTKYFFDAIGASHEGSLTYWKIEKPGDMAAHPGLADDIRGAVSRLIDPLARRKRVLFVDADGACLAPMAWAYAQKLAGDRIDADFAGLTPTMPMLDPIMETCMKEQGIDMGFFRPQGLTGLVEGFEPERIVLLRETDKTISLPGFTGEVISWDIPEFNKEDLEQARSARDRIEELVRHFVEFP